MAGLDELSVASCVGEVVAEFVFAEVKEVEEEEVSECRERDNVGSGDSVGVTDAESSSVSVCVAEPDSD